MTAGHARPAVIAPNQMPKVNNKIPKPRRAIQDYIDELAAVSAQISDDQGPRLSRREEFQLLRALLVLHCNLEAALLRSLDRPLSYDDESIPKPNKYNG